MKNKLKKIKLFYYLNDISKLILNNLKSRRKKLIFAQVPRSSTTIIITLIKNNLKDHSKLDFPNHFFKPKFNKNCNYFISIRDPIERFVSAYNHIKKGQFISYYEDFFFQFPTIEILAKQLFTKKAMSYVRLSHHLNEDLKSFVSLEYLKKNMPSFIISHDDLLKDTENFLKLRFDQKKIDVSHFQKKIITTQKKEINLSKSALMNLKKFLSKDYEIYNYLIKEKQKINTKNNYN